MNYFLNIYYKIILCLAKDITPTPVSTGTISDGYHTFDELYEHRVSLWIKLCTSFSPALVWRSQKHSDGSTYDGWFILGYRFKQGRQITYHLPMSRWNETDFAQTRSKAPKFDGHTSQDVLNRIKEL